MRQTISLTLPCLNDIYTASHAFVWENKGKAQMSKTQELKTGSQKESQEGRN